MDAELSLTTTDKLLYLGRAAWSQARLPLELRRLAIAAEHMRERAFSPGAVLAREGEPLASAYLLVRGRVRVSRRGAVVGEVEAGSLVGFKVLLSQDDLGLGVVAVTDALALQLDTDTLFAILGDEFALLHEGIRSATGTLLGLIRRLPGTAHDPHEAAGLLFPPPAGRRMNLVEVLLFLRTAGGPFERSSIETLADLAVAFRQVPFEPGHVFWREGERADRIGLLVEGNVACSASGAAPRHWCLGPGQPLGLLEAVAWEPRWYAAVAETAGLVLEQDVEYLADRFEDNVEVALDYLAWVTRTILTLIERELGPGRELLEFLTTLAQPGTPSSLIVEPRPDRALEGDLDLTGGTRAC